MDAISKLRAVAAALQLGSPASIVETDDPRTFGDALSTAVQRLKQSAVDAYVRAPEMDNDTQAKKAGA